MAPCGGATFLFIMLVRTSQALIMCPDNGDTVAYNFLKQTSFVCDEQILKVLHFLNDWRSPTHLLKILPEFSRDEVDESISQLVDVGAVVIKGSDLHKEEADKVERWEWGIPSAMLHYCEQNRQFVSRNEAEEIQIERSQRKNAPKLFNTNEAYDKVYEFERPLGGHSAIDLMAKRRTRRDVRQVSIPSNIVADCLFAGLGITSATRNCVGDLPLSMTPSGGARNPYEGYFYAANVDGLDPGFYHYSAVENSLGQISRGAINNPASLIGDQPWINDMSAIVFLCAHFDRTMWKYQDNNAYKVVLIEAGHIGQNIMLAATEFGLTACPSAALSHDQISAHLQLDNPLASPVYALMLGVPENETTGNGFH